VSEKTFQAGDITFDKREVELMRTRTIEMRDNSFKQWPEAIEFTLFTTHLILFLSLMIEEHWPSE
jgi:hypothetical protein